MAPTLQQPKQLFLQERGQLDVAYVPLPVGTAKSGAAYCPALKLAATVRRSSTLRTPASERSFKSATM